MLSSDMVSDFSHCMSFTYSSRHICTPSLPALQPSDRPSVEDLEKLPRVKAGMREIDLLLRE